MSNHAGTQTNGASLEDCHANFFALTDVCGIRWIVYRESECPSGTAKVQNGQDAVLASYAKCLEADLLAVWRRVPKRALLTSNIDINARLSAAETASFDDKNPVSQRKELWIFWYGDKPEDVFKRLVSPELKEVTDISGTWENALPYEARTLLYKALNNLIERNLLSKDFVKLGKWFVQPFEGPEKALQKASHLSFSFQYFVHGESFICASVDVRQHPAVRRLGPHHLSIARGAANPVQVILAPHGLSATLTGVTYKSSDANIAKQLQDWHRFYPLDGNKYTCQDNLGDMVTIAPAVEVIVAGVKMAYPTCYVLVTDMDSGFHQDQLHRSKRLGCSSSQGGSDFDLIKSGAMVLEANNEPSPFTTSNHPLLTDCEIASPMLHVTLTEEAWQDGLSINPESTLSASEQHQQQYHQQTVHGGQGGHNSSINSDLNNSIGVGPGGGPNSAANLMTSDLVSGWDFSYPGRFVKKKPRSKIREKLSKDHRSIRFNSKVPFHKKPEAVDELTWALDQTDMLGATGHASGHSANSVGDGGKNGTNNSTPVNSQPSSNKKAQPSLVSPAPGSVGAPVTPFTPKGSVRTPGGADLLSPQCGAPPSNGPLTPMDMGGEGGKQPLTPRSVPSYPIPSPFDNKPKSVKPQTPQPAISTNPASVKSEYMPTQVNVKTEPMDDDPEGGPESNNADFKPAMRDAAIKRPALPTKEYEVDLESENLHMSEHIFDTSSIRLWLNHPVKRFKPTDSKHNDPFKPAYRRPSQVDGMNTEAVETLHNLENRDAFNIKQENAVQGGNGNQQQKFNNFANSNSPAMGTAAGTPGMPASGTGDGQFDPNLEIKQENGAKQNPVDNGSLFTSEGLQPSINDLDNLFDDSSDETEGNGAGPTPPGSNKPSAGMGSEDPDSHATKLKQQQAKMDSSALPHDQLAKMFPTPPSLEHPSPADGTMEVDHGLVKMEPFSPAPDLTDWWTGGEDFDYTLSSSKFAPLKRLYSDGLPTLITPTEFKYKPQRQPRPNQPSNSANSEPGSNSNNPPGGGNGNNQRVMLGASSSGSGRTGSAATPLGTPTMKQSPPSVEGGPRSMQHHDIASPSAAKDSMLNKESARIPEASSLMLNIILSDTIFNVFRDHNFDSCTICVCSNEGNIRGRDAAPYLPNFQGDDDSNCICGFSALSNRKLAHQSGLFYEDETEITGITEDLYHRKKPSLLLLDPKYNSSSQQQQQQQSNSGNNPENPGSNSNAGGGSNSSGENNAENNANNNSNNSNERMNVVDAIPPTLLELIQEISVYNLTNSQNNSLLKYAKQYLKRSSQDLASISMVDLMDSNYVAFNTLEKVKSLNESGKLDEAQKGTCVHRWTLMQAPGPFCSEDIIRVMKSIQPQLNESLHVKNKKTQQKVDGPLTWRQFHRMAGTTTKGNTDDQCEPLPVPTITVGHEQDFLSLAPQALHYWEAMNLEPYAQPRDVAYFVVSPESDFVVGRVKNFFKNLSCVYESCRLGRHVPIAKFKMDNGVLKVGKKYADKLTNETVDPWFEMIGESSTALLLKLYSQVCRHYLMPLLHQLPLDKTLIESSIKDATKQVLADKTPPSPMPPPSMSNTSDYLMNTGSGASTPGGNASDPLKTGSGKPGEASDADLGKENIGTATEGGSDTERPSEPPAIVIYIVDPFTFGPASDSLDNMRLTTLGLIRCFSQMLPNISETLKNNISLQVVSLESILEIGQSQNSSRMPNQMRGLAFSVFSQARRPLQYVRECKTLTGFGPASSVEKYLKANEDKTKFLRMLHSPAFILAPSNLKSPSSGSEAFGSSNERSSVLFVNYCLSEDQHWLLASCCDDRGELVKTVTINIEIPNKTRRKKASARRVGLRKLMDWIQSVMSMSLVPWRLVIGRIGRIGHGELRGWSVLLSRKALKRASKELKELCPWKSEVPCILSACLTSIEPDSHLRLMSDQYTPDERFGQTASNCQLSTPKDATCTHILVFPTSAKAQSSQKDFHENRDEQNEGDLGDMFGMNIMDDLPDNDNIDIDNINDLFNDDNWNDPVGGDTENQRSPGGMRNDISQPSTPSGQNKPSGSDQFRYGQEEPDERIEILQQPLALGYMVSTAKTGPMPRWFWASCPHLENSAPVFLKSALHINVASLMTSGEDGFDPRASSGRVHSLDSNYTADVLRYVLEGYNALSWLSLDFENHDRKSCLPLNVQVLLQMYNSLAALV